MFYFFVVRNEKIKMAIVPSEIINKSRSIVCLF